MPDRSRATAGEYTMLLGFIGIIVGAVIGAAITAVIMLRRQSHDQAKIKDLTVRLATSDATLKAEQEKNTWTEERKEQLENTFKALASEELEVRTNSLKETAKEQLGVVVDPLAKELKNLDEHVRKLESKREGAYKELGTQIKLLNELQGSLKDQTATLAQALRAPTVRGRWGEVQLRRLAELAGMQDHVDFDEQVSGESGRPDMIVHLPQGGVLPIDSKVSLGDFLRAMETDDEEVRKQGLIAHAKAVRSRVKELSTKAYWEQFKEETPEVVVMFVPVEASLGAAFQHDPALFEYAIDNRVLVVSPVLLFALLKTISHGWQQHQITENAVHIAEHGKNLYDRVLKFLDFFSGVGKSIDSSVKRYNEALGSLESRLIPAARRFRDMIASPKDVESPKQIENQTRQVSVPEDEIHP
jgi:DNA recombination protein RmuC